MTKNVGKVKNEPTNPKLSFVAAGDSGLVRTVRVFPPLKKTGGLLRRSPRTKNVRKVKNEQANPKSSFVAAVDSGLVRTVRETPLKKTGDLLRRSPRNKNLRVCIEETKKVGITRGGYNAKERKVTKEKKIDTDVNVTSLNHQPELCKKNDRPVEVKEEVKEEPITNDLCIELELTSGCQNNKKRVQHFDDDILKKSEVGSDDTAKKKRRKSDISFLKPSGIDQELCVGNKEGSKTNLTDSNSQISQWVPDGGRTTCTSSSAQLSNNSSQVSELLVKSQQAGFQNEENCENQMLELLEKQQREEKEKPNENYIEKVAELEKEKRIEVLVMGYICKSMLDGKLKSLDHEYATKFENLKCQTHVPLKELKTMQLTGSKSTGEQTELLKTPPLEKASEVPTFCNQENIISQPSEVHKLDQTVVTHEQTTLQLNSNHDKEIDREETTNLNDKEKQQREEEETLNDTKTIEVGVEEGSKLHDSTKSLYFSLKPEIITLCNLFQFPDKVKLMAEEFLEYVMSNHQVHREPTTILQAFQISLCQRAASILKYKFHPEESFKLAKQHLDFSCKIEEVDLIYSMLKSVKNAFLLSREKCKKSEPSTTEKNCGTQMLQQREEKKKLNESSIEETAQPKTKRNEVSVVSSDIAKLMVVDKLTAKKSLHENDTTRVSENIPASKEVEIPITTPLDARVMAPNLLTPCETGSAPTFMVPENQELVLPRDSHSNSSAQILPTTTCEISSTPTSAVQPATCSAPAPPHLPLNASTVFNMDHLHVPNWRSLFPTAPRSVYHDDPLQPELERLRKELNQTVATHEQNKSQLNTICAKEIADVVALIRRKYDTKLKNLEAEFLAKKKETADRVEKVQMQSLLAAAMRAKCNDTRRVRASPELSQGTDPRSVQRQTQQITQQTRQFPLQPRLPPQRPSHITEPRQKVVIPPPQLPSQIASPRQTVNMLTPGVRKHFFVAHEEGQRTQQAGHFPVHPSASNSRQAAVVPPPRSHITSTTQQVNEQARGPLIPVSNPASTLLPSAFTNAPPHVTSMSSPSPSSSKPGPRFSARPQNFPQYRLAPEYKPPQP